MTTPAPAAAAPVAAASAVEPTAAAAASAPSTSPTTGTSGSSSHSLYHSISAPFAFIASGYSSFRDRYNLSCPGPFENLHREIKNTLPTLHMIEGAKFDITSIMSPNFQVSHSFQWGSSQSPPNYSFAAGYQGANIMMNGQVDHDGALQGRAHYAWGVPSTKPDFYVPAPSPSPAADSKEPPQPPTPPLGQRPSAMTKLQLQLSRKTGQSMVQFEHDHVGDSFSWNVKAINPNPFDAKRSSSPLGGGPGRTVSGAVGLTTTGIFSLGYLQSLTPALAVGTEVMLQRVRADEEEVGVTLGARWAPAPSGPLPLPTNLPAGFPSPYMPINPRDPVQVFSATYSPTQGIVHGSYWRRVNQRLELAAEIQMLVTGAKAVPAAAEGAQRSVLGGKGSFEYGRREAIASAGFKLDTVYAGIRSMIDSMGRVTTVIEQRISPGLSFQIAGELDYSKPQGGAGRVGFGFTFEA
ncbi:eukaryotic porin-domain-containing protein [Zopfochytrium polystomum]|nr:eukaryotic porin-domain-containing protein [Zopfochytrium polystomum]